MKDARFLYQIRAEAGKDEAEILIYDEIGKNWFGEGVGAEQFVKDLAQIKAKLLTVRINSGGGSVFEGLAIYNALKRYDGKVVTEIDSLAASIASVIALAGTEVRMADNAFFMVHNPHGVAVGNAQDMLEFAALLEKVGGSLARVYAEHTGADEKQVQAWMDAETWFTAEEAKAAGFVTQIMAGKEIRAAANLGEFRNAPARLKAALEDMPPVPEPDEDDEDEDEDDDTPDAAAGDAASASATTPAQPASEARENTMSGQDTAAQQIEAALKKDRERRDAIDALCAEHKIDAQKSAQWGREGRSIEEVNALVLSEIRARTERAPVVRQGTRVEGVRNRAENDPRRGFESHRDFLVAVMENQGATARENVRDERLRTLAVADDEGPQGQPLAFLLPRALSPKSIRAAAGSDEQATYDDAYGGYLKQVQVLPGLLSVGFEGDPTEGLTTKLPMAAPIVKINARTDKNHTTSVSGGLTFGRTAEAVEGTASRMTMEQITMEATALIGAAHATEQVLTDSPVSFAALIAAGFDSQRGAHLLNEKIRGTGGNEYAGILNAACKVQVDKETGQAADTIVYDNVLNMRARCWGYGQAVWMANPDCLPQLAKMSLAIGTGGAPVYVPGSFGERPETLLGRPIIYAEHMATVGDAGDIALVNWSQYLEGIYQPMRSDESIHVRFLRLERTFRFYERNCGAPWWRSALTPAKGSNTLSPIVTLAARA